MCFFNFCRTDYLFPIMISVMEMINVHIINTLRLFFEHLFNYYETITFIFKIKTPVYVRIQKIVRNMTLPACFGTTIAKLPE